MTDYDVSYLIDVSTLNFADTSADAGWVHALPVGSYKHPLYGSIDISMDRVKRFVDSVKNKVRGTVDPSINFDHKDGEAAGWVKDAQVRTDGLWLFIDWVKDVADKIREKKYRYFSSEFLSKWTDPQGKEHTDVVVGGALTNRPWMKNLVPINLSEATWDQAFDLVALATGKELDTLKGGNEPMPITEDDRKAIVADLTTNLKELFAAKPTETPAAPETKLSDIPELVALAAENPMVKVLIDTVERQNTHLAESAKAMKDRDIAMKLSEFDRSKIVLTPVARQQVINLLDAMPTTLHEQFWMLLTEMRKGTSMMVELGERAGATVNYGTVKSAVVEFNEAATKLATERKISPADAYSIVSQEQPALWERYRKETVGA